MLVPPKAAAAKTRLWNATRAAHVKCVCLVLMLACAAQFHHHHRNGPPPSCEDEQMAELDAHLSKLPVLYAAEMKPVDRELLQEREVDVSRAAAFYGLDISDSHWTYQQI